MYSIISCSLFLYPKVILQMNYLMEIQGGALEPEEMAKKWNSSHSTEAHGIRRSSRRKGKKLNENSSFAISPITHFILYLYTYMSALKCINEHEFFTDGAIEHRTAQQIEVNPIGHVVKHQRSCLYRRRAYIKGTIQKLWSHVFIVVCIWKIITIKTHVFTHSGFYDAHST